MNNFKELHTNFDPQVHELLKESIYMQKMNLEISENAKNLILLQPRIERNYSQTQDMLARYNHLLDRVPKDLLPLMKPNKENVDSAVRPGLISVTWVSNNIEECKFTTAKSNVLL